MPSSGPPVDRPPTRRSVGRGRRPGLAAVFQEDPASSASTTPEIAVGYVENGYLQADGDIRVDGGVIRSQLLAGARVWVYGKLQAALPTLHEGVTRLIAAMQALRNAASSRRRDISRVGSGRLVQLLLEKKFGRIREEARAVHDMLQAYEGPLDASVERLRKPLEWLASGRIDDGFEVKSLEEDLREALQFLADFEVPGTAKAVVAYAHHAVLLSGGKITVGPDGTYHTRVVARDRVLIQGAAVGGTVEASQSIYVTEAGSPAMPTTTLVVSNGGTIRVNHAHENVWVQVGSHKRRLHDDHHDLHVTASSLQ